MLDVGCGWGRFVKFAAERYGAKAVGVTVSQKQLELATILCKGLPAELRLQYYRDDKEKFDHIVSIGMFEDVGHRNHRTYMKVARKCLKMTASFFCMQSVIIAQCRQVIRGYPNIYFQIHSFHG